MRDKEIERERERERWGGDLSMSEKCIVSMCMVVLAHWSFFCLFVCVCMVGFASQYSFFFCCNNSQHCYFKNVNFPQRFECCWPLYSRAQQI